MQFESSMKRLDEIVKKLEGNDLSLEESLDLYKEGVELSVECKKSLEKAKLQVKTLAENKSSNDDAE